MVYLRIEIRTHDNRRLIRTRLTSAHPLRGKHALPFVQSPLQPSGAMEWSGREKASETSPRPAGAPPYGACLYFITKSRAVSITLSEDSLDNIEGVTLFKTTGGVTGLADFTVTFVDATGAEKKAAVSYNNGSVVTGAISEPTTTTLSLLAMAGLVARRRRK